MKRLVRWAAALAGALGIVYACGFDATLRAYLNTQFWLPIFKGPRQLVKRAKPPASAAFAGMRPADAVTPLGRLRSEYQATGGTSAKMPELLTAARATGPLSKRDQEEVDLIDAKVDLRRDRLPEARAKLAAFLRKARTPAYLSEARGWLARVHYLSGDQTAAGKIYFDELGRAGSNLSEETLLTSLNLTYGDDGGIKLREHLEEYFDTPEHAAFAIHLATNPGPDRHYDEAGEPSPPPPPPPYLQIQGLLERHRELFQTPKGAEILALLSLRCAMSAADPAAALRLASLIPADASVRSDPDFLWMTASAHFLLRDCARAGEPLRRLFDSPRASSRQKTAAAYGLCAVYLKTSDAVAQLQYALWLRRAFEPGDGSNGPPAIGNISMPIGYSGWDANLLLEWEASIEALRGYLAKHPGSPDATLVRYSLAVRLAREDRYGEAAELYAAVKAPERSARMKELDRLHRDASGGAPGARYRLAAFLAANPERLYFNDRLWHGMQNYSLYASQDPRLTRAERERTIAGERKLRDDQEERWRAYLILRSEPGRPAAELALRCVRRISERFGRADELRRTDFELTRRLKPPAQLR